MAMCPSCHVDIIAGTRWCGICRANLVNREAGRLATPGRRLGAHVLDLAIPLVAILLIVVIAGAGAATNTNAGGGIGVLLGGGLFLAYVAWAFLLFTRGMTPGKKFLGMRVIKEDGSHAGFFTMLIREWIGKAISTLLFSLGFLWILIDRDRQGWHDKLLSTYVVE